MKNLLFFVASMIGLSSCKDRTYTFEFTRIKRTEPAQNVDPKYIARYFTTDTIVYQKFGTKQDAEMEAAVNTKTYNTKMLKHPANDSVLVKVTQTCTYVKK